MIDFSTGVVNAKRGILLPLVHFNNDPYSMMIMIPFFVQEKILWKDGTSLAA